MRKLYWIAFAAVSTLLTGCFVVVEEPYVVVDPRDNFTGIFEVEEFSQVYDATTYYNVEVTKSPYELDVVWISNFYGIELDIYGVVSGGDVQIPRQTIGNYEVDGWGYLTNEGRLRLFFTFVEHRPFGSLIDECDALFYALY
ncbi:MAG: hypothetical protein AAFQ98_02965 [Bacteroidota bacterium]